MDRLIASNRRNGRDLHPLALGGGVGEGERRLPGRYDRAIAV